MNKTSQYKCGDKVRVVQGVNDPDLNINIGGWSGEINEIEPPVDNGPWLYNILLDRETLLMASEIYISIFEEQNLDYEMIYLEENELELIESNLNKKSGVFIA